METLIKRRDVQELYSAMDQTSHLVPDQHEDMEQFNRFKYAVGKNYRRLESTMAEIDAQLRSILYADDVDFNAYRTSLKQVAEQYADRDDNGAVVYLDPDQTQVRIQDEAMPLYQADLDDLRQRYASFLARQAERERQADVYLDGMVYVHLHRFPFSKLPRSLGGVWMTVLSPMIDGLPDELC